MASIKLNRTLLVLIGLLLVSLGTFRLVNRLTPSWLNAVQVDITKAASKPTKTTNKSLILKNFMTQATFLKTNEKGHLVTEMHAAYLYAFNNHTITLKSPRMIFYKESSQYHDPPKPYWAAQSLSGYINDTGVQTVYLKGDVKLTQYTTSGAIRRTFYTSALTVIPKRQYVTTNQHVTLKEANTQLEADGLQADLKNDRIELISNVRGQHDTHHSTVAN